MALHYPGPITVEITPFASADVATNPADFPSASQFKIHIDSIRSHPGLTTAEKDHQLFTAAHAYMVPIHDSLHGRYRISREENHNLWHGRQITMDELLRDPEQMASVRHGLKAERDEALAMMSDDERRRDQERIMTTQSAAEIEHVLRRNNTLLEDQVRVERTAAARAVSQGDVGVGLGHVMPTFEDEKAGGGAHKREVNKVKFLPQKWREVEILLERLEFVFRLLLLLFRLCIFGANQFGLLGSVAKSTPAAVGDGTAGVNGTVPMASKATLTVTSIFITLESASPSTLGSSSLPTNAFSSLTGIRQAPIARSSTTSSTTNATTSETTIATAETTTVPGVSAW